MNKKSDSEKLWVVFKKYGPELEGITISCAMTKRKALKHLARQRALLGIRPARFPKPNA